MDAVSDGDLGEYAKNLGKITSHLQSLELVLRAFLLEAEARDRQDRADSPLPKVVYHQLEVGEWVEVDAFTNYDQLSRLIGKYNKRVGTLDGCLQIDSSLVDLRNALAHGRVAAHAPSGPMHLLKFSGPRKKSTDPNKKEVRVTFTAEMNASWFKKEIRRSRNSIERVVATGKRLDMDSFRDSQLLNRRT